MRKEFKFLNGFSFRSHKEKSFRYDDYFRAFFSLLITLFFIAPSNGQIDTALLHALKNCDLATVQKRVKNSIDINAKDSNGANALMWAAYYCDLPVVKYLLQQGATVPDPAVIYMNPRKTGYYGNIQGIAASKEKPELLKYLGDTLRLPLDEKQYDPFERKKNSWTPLFWAVAYGRTDLVNYLVEKGVKIDVLDEEGCCTPLIIAAENENWGAFDRLITAGALKKLGSGADYFQATASRLARKYPDRGYISNEPELQQFIVDLKKAYFGPTHFSYAKSLNDLANTCFQRQAFDTTELLYRQALTVLEKAGIKQADYANSLHGLADLYALKGDYKKALPLLQQAAAVTKDFFGGTHTAYGSVLHDLAVLHDRMGEQDKALPLLEQALEILKEVEAQPKKYLTPLESRYLSTLEKLAGLYERTGQFDRALPLWKRATVAAREIWGERHPNYAVSLNNLATAYQTTGQFEKALPLLQQAVAIRKEQETLVRNEVVMEKHPDYAQSLNDLAVLYERIGKFEKALPLLQQAAAILKEILGEKHSRYIPVLENLAGIYYKTGRVDRAQALYEQILATRKELADKYPDYSSALNNLAGIYNSMGQYEKSLPLLQQVLAIRKKVWGEEHPYYANSLNNLGSLFLNLGNYDKALSFLRQALAIRTKVFGREHPDNVSSLNALGWLYSRSGKPGEAAASLTEAGRIESRYLTRTFSFLSEQEKMAFQQKESWQFHYLPSLLMKPSMVQPELTKQLFDNELVVKGMVLEDQQRILQSVRQSRDSSVLEVYRQWRLYKSFLGKQLLQPVSRRVFYLKSLEETVDRLEQQLSRISEPFRNQWKGLQLTAGDVARSLQKDQAAIEFLRFELFNDKWTDTILYAAMVMLPSDSTIRFVPLFEEGRLLRLLKNSGAPAEAGIQQLYRGGVVTGEGTYAISDSLYQLIWKPLENYFSGTGIRTIFYAPAGLLHQVAFGALRPDSTHVLIEKYQLCRLLSTRSLALPVTVTQKPLSVGIWGDITYDLPTFTSGIDTTVSAFSLYNWDAKASRSREWNALPGTRLEMDSLNRVFVKSGTRITTYNGAEATEEAFKALDGRSPQVLHLATHGFFLPVEVRKTEKTGDLNAVTNAFSIQEDPMFRSGLLLAGANHAWKGGAAIPDKEDGIVTAYEIAQMDLSHTDLVVLSACETGLGDVQGNEGVIGLQRAFRMAGVKQMIMSLWRVPDKETVELTTLFYRYWLSGQTPRQALRSAQLKMKEKYAPYYWAAFVLVE